MVIPCVFLLLLILCIEINMMFMISLLACVIVVVLIMDEIMLYVYTMYLNCCMLLMCMHKHPGDGSFPLCGIELAGLITVPNG